MSFNQVNIERIFMKWRGVSYDVGRVMGMNWRPIFEAVVIQRELEIIKNDLHCNAIRICGFDIRRLSIASEMALKLELEVLFCPEIWHKSQEKTLNYILKAADAAEILNAKYPGRLIFGIGSEFTLFTQGILPGKSLMKRVRHPMFWDNIKAGKHNEPLNFFLAKITNAVKKVFHGKLTYASLIWEKVDWNIFDIVCVDHYREERINDQYIDMLKPLFDFGKPIINSEFGCRTYKGAENSGAMGFGIINFPTLGLHQIPLIGRFIKPRIKGVHVRDENLQANAITTTLELLKNAGVDGVFVITFVTPIFPYNDNPKYDLDMSSFSLVKSYTKGNKGLIYPDMPWDPKKSFYAVANFYSGL